ncbi:hypothetical protein HY989_00040 [Candidatus Micrarchaeota archaeon]|nr:hypothetical protein [Candidatus Micrarchaeota archaeon]
MAEKQMEEKQKRIVIPNNELHPDFEHQIDAILNARKFRSLNRTTAAAFSVAGITLSKEIGGNGGFYLGMLGGAGAGHFLIDARKNNVDVRRLTRAMPEIINIETWKNSKRPELASFDKYGEYKINKLDKTHPFRFIDRKGNLHLLPSSKVQRALYRAQQTFLREIVPGRQRFK